MKKFFLLLVFVLARFAGTAQSPVDSLRHVFNTATVDSVKWLALFHISQWHSQQNIDSALWYAREGLAFAQKHTPQLLPRSLNNVGLQYMNRGDLDKAMEYYLQSIDAAKKNACTTCLATTIGNLGIIYWNKKDLGKAEEQLRQSLDRAVLLTDDSHRIIFSTRLAEDLLHKHHPARTAGCLPTPLSDQLQIRRFAEPGRSDLQLFLLEEKGDPPGPRALTVLGLTPREAEVLYWIAQGKSNPDIATILSANVRTVHKHVEHIFQKLGLETRNAAMLAALDVLRPSR